MKDRGIGILYGRWLIEGAPRVLLIDTKTAYKHLDEWKTDLWNVASIPSPPGDDETNEAIVFGYLVAWFLGEVRIHIEGELPASRFVHPTLTLLSCCSTFATRRRRQSLPISTNGLRELDFHCAKSDALMSPPSSPLTPLCWEDIFVPAPSTFTTTSSGLMWMLKLASVVFTTDTASSVPPPTRAMSSLQSRTSLLTKASTCSSASLMVFCPTD